MLIRLECQCFQCIAEFLVLPVFYLIFAIRNGVLRSIRIDQLLMLNDLLAAVNQVGKRACEHLQLEQVLLGHGMLQSHRHSSILQHVRQWYATMPILFCYSE